MSQVTTLVQQRQQRLLIHYRCSPRARVQWEAGRGMAQPLDDSSNSTPILSLDYDYPVLDAVDGPGQAVLIALYSVTAVLALVGNTTVIVVLVLGKRSARGLRVFLINLAATDVTMAVFSIPFTYTSFLLGHWIFAPAFCPVANFMQHVSVTGSVYTLTAIGMDRYYAIMYPLHPRWTKTRGVLIVLSIWLWSIAVSTVQLVFSRAEILEWGERSLYICEEKWSEYKGTHETITSIYTIFVFMVTFILPLLVLAFTYASIAIVLWRRSSPGNANTARDRQQLQDKIKVVKMLALVVAMFALCWLPLHIFNLLVHLYSDFSRNFGKSGRNSDYTIVFFTCHWLSMANSFINPVIYCFMSDNFWGDLRTLLLRCVGLLSGSPRGRCSNSFHSTSYILSFRKNSGTSHGSLQMRRVGENSAALDRQLNEDTSTRLMCRRSCLAEECTCVIPVDISNNKYMLQE